MTCLGRRRRCSRDSCASGLRFGSFLVYVEEDFVYVGLRNNGTSWDVLIAVSDTCDLSPKKSLVAFTDLRGETAVEIHKLLRYVIDGRITKATYEKELMEWIAVEELWRAAHAPRPSATVEE
jgi:hypothetical protein